jgi:predicted dehydrogenase
VPDARIFADYQEMLREVQPDIVSICTWPHLHAEMVVACAEAGIHAVHSEKPMAPTYGEARRMHEAAVKAGMQLTLNHQRRFEEPYVTCKRLIEEGAIGNVVQMQAAAPNLYDWGTHWFDMLNFYNGDVPVEWVMGQIDSRSVRSVFGVRMEDQGVSYFGYQNGVRGMLITGDQIPRSHGWPNRTALPHGRGASHHRDRGLFGSGRRRFQAASHEWSGSRLARGAARQWHYQHHRFCGGGDQRRVELP